VADDPAGGRMTLSGSGDPTPLFCDNETNARRLWGAAAPPYPKDGINDHVIGGAATVNPERVGTKAALWYRLEVDAGATAELRLRLTADEAADLGGSWSDALESRAGEADAFYASLAPAATPDEALVMRQAFAGMLWSKQFYHYDVERWLAGDPGQPPPPAGRQHGRNAGWPGLQPRRHLDAGQVGVPWYAAWDLAFHCITLAHVDPAFAKEQLQLITREWYMHPNGQLPAYEWNIGDVKPAGPRARRPRGVRDRRRRGPAMARADLSQVAARLHLVGEREGP
jgi:hypothetical protein